MEKRFDKAKILLFLKEKTSKSLKWTLDNWRNFLLVLLFVLCTVFYCSYRSAERRYGNIIQKKDDEISLYKNKVGELYAQNETYITDIKNLKISNDELYSEVKNLKENPIVVTKIKTETKIREIFIHDTIYKVPDDDMFWIGFEKTDPWYGIFGRTSVNIKDMIASTMIDSLYFVDNITVDLIENGKDLSFIVKSDNPNCQINKINGAVISPEKSRLLKKRFDSRWSIVGGIGGTLMVQERNLRVVPGLQITIGRKIVSF